MSVGLLAVALAGAALGVGAHVRSQAVRQGAAVVAAAQGRQPASDAVRPGSASAQVARPAHASSLRPAVAMLPRSTPLTLAIPSVRLSAPLLGLGMDGKGAAELPPFSLPHMAGWLRDSAAPGERGTSVIVGHVDTTTGPAVFWNLSAVRPGAEVDVNRVDGRTAVFTVDQVRAYPKPAFPAAQVYGPGPGAQLRVITCGGGFDRARHEYTGNVVLFAHLSGSR
ncbi:class F sortase [Streptacidiphilus fuscans]|uniref:Class F sortase n=1 Tax=Streptacidiphilus fuscans TaxID=2789292 RepID=A0A931B8F6_9ACTN|nr:class F sortase [Streptacidiphilus fuscans]MBF9072399.1 class F sortase [Streptacidiphilus fuscans]